MEDGSGAAKLITANEIEPVVAPRPGHLALVLAAGVADGAVIDTADMGRSPFAAKRAMWSRSRASRLKPTQPPRTTGQKDHHPPETDDHADIARRGRHNRRDGR